MCKSGFCELVDFCKVRRGNVFRSKLRAGDFSAFGGVQGIQNSGQWAGDEGKRGDNLRCNKGKGERGERGMIWRLGARLHCWTARG